MLKKRFFIRYFLLLAVFAFAVFYYGGRLLNMQIANANQYVRKIEGTYTRTFVETAIRGEIFDRNGVPLVTNRNTYNLTVDGKKFNKKEYVAELMDLVNLIIFYNGTIEPDTLPLLPPIISADGSLKYSYSMTATNERDRRYLTKFLAKNGMNENASAAELVTFLTTKYKLDGYMPPEGRDPNLFRTVLGICYEFDRQEILGEIYGQRYTVCKDISNLLMTVIKENAHSLPGVEILGSYERVYNIPTSAPHILGKTGKIQDNIESYRAKGYSDDAIVGIDGVELAFEEYLRGVDGETERTYDKETGNIISQRYIKEPVAGKDVYLTIDIKLQQVAEYSIVKGIDRIHGLAYSPKQRARYNPKTNGADAEAGAVAIINPNNGEVLALATYPSYDISTAYSDMEVFKQLNEDPLHPFENRAVRGQYAPGSVFKIVTSVAALCNGNITPNSSFTCWGQYTRYSDFQPKCWIYPRSHGTMSLYNALSVSCNCYYFNVGELVGIQKLNEYAKRMGLGDKTGIEISEKTGIILSPESSNGWVQGDVLRASIGQLSTYTPLQMANMLGTVMLGGERYKNHLLLCVKEYGSDEIYYAPEPVLVDKIEISEENLNTVRWGLGNVIENGTAAALFNNMGGIRVAGKTGTVQVGSYQSRSEDATFVAAAPLSKPEISMAVVIEKGAHGTWAGYVAEDIMMYYFGVKSFNESLGLPPEIAGEAGE